MTIIDTGLQETEVRFTHDVEVQWVDSMGSDESIVQAARVSVVGANEAGELTEAKVLGLLGYLMKNKHGSPFEHNSMTFYVKAPIFVFREFQRHRIGMSYNERSARYSEMEPEFYTPAADRPIVNIGTSSDPKMAPAEPNIIEDLNVILSANSENAWARYKHLLDLGVAKEVARMVLPVNIMSEMYVTLNARSMMNFLSLRVQDESAVHVSKPQWEIQLVAKKMEAIFGDLFPITWALYQENGRVAP